MPSATKTPPTKPKATKAANDATELERTPCHLIARASVDELRHIATALGLPHDGDRAKLAVHILNSGKLMCPHCRRGRLTPDKHTPIMPRRCNNLARYLDHNTQHRPELITSGKLTCRKCKCTTSSILIDHRVD